MPSNNKETDIDSRLDIILNQAEELFGQFIQLGSIAGIPNLSHLSPKLGKDDSQDFNDFLTMQCTAIEKKFRAMPISGRWPLANKSGSLLLERKAHQEDGDIWTDRNPVANYTNRLTITSKNGQFSLGIEQNEDLDGQRKLSSVTITKNKEALTFISG